jgi:hypothetical protein
MFGQKFYDINTHQQDVEFRINPSLPEFTFSFFFAFDTLSNPIGISRIEIRQAFDNRRVQTIKMPKIVHSYQYYKGYIFGAKDMNFDGFLDLLLELGNGDSTGSHKFKVWLYDSKSGNFKFDPQFEDLLNPETDPIAKTITSFSWSSKSPYSKSIYRFEDKKLILFQQEQEECVRSNKYCIRNIASYNNGKITSVTSDTLQGLWNYLSNNPAIEDSVKSICKTASDSLIPISLEPYSYEIAFRILNQMGYCKYSFVFKKDPQGPYHTNVLVSEVLENNIFGQLAMLFQINPKLSKVEALSKVKVRKYLLKGEDHPELDTLMRSIFKIQFSIPHLEDGAFYLDPPTYEIRIENESIHAKLDYFSSDNSLVEWALNIKELLYCLN